MDIEITVWSVNATTPPEKVAAIAAETGSTAANLDGTRKVFDPASGVYLDAGIIHRDGMQQGQRAKGPAAVTEAETTIIVPASRDAICQPDGCIDVMVRG